MFGVISEQYIVILVDCSASMATHWSELTNQIELLLNNQLIPRGIFATRLSPQAVYFIQTGSSALSNTYRTIVSIHNAL